MYLSINTSIFKSNESFSTNQNDKCLGHSVHQGFCSKRIKPLAKIREMYTSDVFKYLSKMFKYCDEKSNIFNNVECLRVFLLRKLRFSRSWFFPHCSLELKYKSHPLVIKKIYTKDG